MLLLVDTSHSPRMTVAVVEDGVVLAAKTGPSRRRETDAVLAGVDDVLRRAKRRLVQIRGLAVVRGPGQFSASAP